MHSLTHSNKVYMVACSNVGIQVVHVQVLYSNIIWVAHSNIVMQVCVGHLTILCSPNSDDSAGWSLTNGHR